MKTNFIHDLSDCGLKNAETAEMQNLASQPQPNQSDEPSSVKISECDHKKTPVLEVANLLKRTGGAMVGWCGKVLFYIGTAALTKVVEAFLCIRLIISATSLWCVSRSAFSYAESKS